MHEKVSCTGCHLKPIFTDVGKNCADCHADIHRRQFGANCAQCHTVNGWNVSVQQINNHFNRFPLLGAHAVVQCDQCHTNAAAGQFTGLSTNCDSCHMKDWQNTTSPAHAAAPASFPPSQCQQCHQSFDTWLGSTAVNHALPPINFPLTQGHANVACEQCHIGGNYHLQIALNDCGNSQCHLTTWQQTNNPPHQAAGAAFAAANCSNCHTPASWNTANFDHSVTGFLLTLGHANLACASCHLNNNYNLTITARDCGNSQCHLTDWNNTNAPVHSTAGSNFAAANCANCHTPAGWTTAAFDHSVTGFTLIGTHMSPTPTPCSSCHYGPSPYTLSSTDCYGCHQQAFLSTQTAGGSVPNHVAAQFPTSASACASCHPITTWSAGTFNHAAPPINFPLTNAHASLACSQCHVGNDYSLQIAATDCGNSQCHLTTYNQTKNPPHLANAALFPIKNCSNCHTTVSWTAPFDHSTTGFPLTGAHVSVACGTCHTDNYAGTLSKTCDGCHDPLYVSTATLVGVPNHVALSYPKTCDSCHTTITWLGALFTHSLAQTGFALTGAHTSTACSLCHTDNYTGALPMTCDGCHDALYVSTANMGGAVPNHVALTYPKTCDSCHTTTTWLGALFNHAATRFGALTGAHATIACNLCHTSATPPPLACSGCHMDKWLSTQTLGGQIPNHVAAALIPSSGFSLAACATCHNTTAWTGALFAHPWFPTTHGRNAAGGVCTVCHIVAGDYSQFQCTVCHSNSSQLSARHQGIGGYAFNSPACYRCHANAP